MLDPPAPEPRNWKLDECKEKMEEPKVAILGIGQSKSVVVLESARERGTETAKHTRTRLATLNKHAMLQSCDCFAEK